MLIVWTRVPKSNFHGGRVVSVTIMCVSISSKHLVVYQHKIMERVTPHERNKGRKILKENKSNHIEKKRK